MASASVIEFSPPATLWRDTTWRHLRGGLKGSEYSWAIAFLVPYVAVFVTFVVYPALYGLWMGIDPALYTDLISDPIYQSTVVNTLLFLAFAVNLKMFCALLLSGYFMRPGWWVKALLMIYTSRRLRSLARM